MFREMRRKDKQLSEEKTLEILNNGEVGILVELTVDNSASGTWYVALVLDDSLIAFEHTESIVIYSWPIPQLPLQPLEEQSIDLLAYEFSTAQYVTQKISYSNYVTDKVILETLKPQTMAKTLTSVNIIR